MKATGLTSGALYSQFKNKDDLCVQAICAALDAMLAEYGAVVDARGVDGLKEIVGAYLADRHRDDVSGGCVFAALAGDMARSSAGGRRAYQLRVRSLIDLFTRGLGVGPERARRQRAEVMVSTMLGALTLARAVDDLDLARRLLAAAREGVLAQF
jgi:TetR/AcrR family transcriptional regulator, transcriptional repressor for nem operon